MHKRAGLPVLAMALAALLAGCAGAPTPTPTHTPTPEVSAPTITLPPTWTPVGRIAVSALAELTLRAGPNDRYHAVSVMPAGHEATAFGRDQHNAWAQVRYGTLTGWVRVEDEAVAQVDGDLGILPVVPVEPITNTPPPPTATFTPFPTFTPRPTRTRAPTNTPAPTPEDRDSRALPKFNLGVLGLIFEETGSGILALPEDEFDYIAFQFNPEASGQLSLEVAFTCDNPDAELLLTLFSSRRFSEELQHLYPVCNQGPLYFRALEPGDFYQIRIWLRDAAMPFVEISPTPEVIGAPSDLEGEPAAPPEATPTTAESAAALEAAAQRARLETHYTFTIRNPQRQ
ncbi:MAG: hypothetical protein Kow00120_16150 [Anaerolineae bacterium]